VNQLAFSASRGQLGFYPLNQFAVYQNFTKSNDTLHFPEFLFVSKNHFQLKWTLSRNPRRLKNVVMVLEWTPTHLEVNQNPRSKVQPSAFSVEQENQLLRCFQLFDTDDDGKLTIDDLSKVSFGILLNFLFFFFI
jgi:hypothetical protein